MKTGGQLIVDCLEANGSDRIYCVPGESYLAVLDALHDSPVRTIVCRQEGGAAMMADAHGKLTGEPGICFVTRGPGATNASAGLHISMQDSTPVMLFIGQVALKTREREAFQEVEYRRAFTEFAKWVVEIDDPARIPELVTRAYSVATSGRPGPVVIVLPEDMLLRRTDAAPAPQRYVRVEAQAGGDETAAVAETLRSARNPFVVAGGAGWSEQGTTDLRAMSEAWRLPVGCSFRRQMLFDHLHPNYAGDIGIGLNPKLAGYIRQSDVVILLGGRLSEMQSSDYSLLNVPYPEQKLIHIHADPDELGRVYRADIAINAGPASFAAALNRIQPDGAPPWADETSRLHENYLEWSTPPMTGPGDVQMGPIMNRLESILPEDAIMTNGAGNFSTWLHRFHRFRRHGTQAAPTSGSMGYGTPAAVAAKDLFPDRLAVAFAGDGCFLMNGQEFATAVQYDLPIIVIIINNGIYGTIRMHQEREYPGRISATNLTNPDFAALARAYGGHGETVEKTAEFMPAFERARDSGKPSIIEIKLHPEAITPTRTLTQIREKT